MNERVYLKYNMHIPIREYYFSRQLPIVLKQILKGEIFI